ncbi:hypothetical protein [Oricola sp.]|uniref:hypothetical protein n=1 Tax=Oricola sp. TaxID=1979950 RepID=UPI0025FB7F77|nr:hypothetical protein [Oricola sp.]MCI5078240.1 hypothetical protein [Oricola sp.]
MQSATLNLNLSPRRMMKIGEAAHYCGMAEKRFKALCGVSPVAMPDGSHRWDLQDLDRWIDSLKAGGGTEADEIVDRL